MYARISVQTGDFSLDAVINELKQETKAVGGICSFTGCVRDINDGEDVSSLFLEHYPEMTEKQLAKILREGLMSVSYTHLRAHET